MFGDDYVNRMLIIWVVERLLRRKRTILANRGINCLELIYRRVCICVCVYMCVFTCVCVWIYVCVMASYMYMFMCITCGCVEIVCACICILYVVCTFIYHFQHFIFRNLHLHKFESNFVCFSLLQVSVISPVLMIMKQRLPR